MPHDDQRESDYDKRQDMRTPPQQAVDESMSVDDNDRGETDEQREREQKGVANRGRGGSIAGGGSRDE